MRSWVEVSLGQIRANYRAVRNVVGAAADVMAVVKADAYRHGAVEVSRALEAEGAAWLAVSNVEEGVYLRRQGIRARILVMADFLPEERAGLEEFNLTPVIHSLEDLPAARVPYHLKIDSGMGRLGTRADAQEIARAVQGAPSSMEGLMTHFASSGNYESRQTEDQLVHFESVLSGLRAAGLAPRYIHAAGTIPVAYGRKAAWWNLVRPGHAIYGYVSPARGSAPKRKLVVRPALSWKATVLAVKDLEAGALVGYGGIHRALRPMRIAVLASAAGRIRSGIAGRTRPVFARRKRARSRRRYSLTLSLSPAFTPSFSVMPELSSSTYLVGPVEGYVEHGSLRHGGTRS